MKTKRIVTAIVAAALALAACTQVAEVEKAGSGTSAGESTPSHSAIETAPIEADMPAIPEGLEKFYNQELTWQECDKEECADLTVPMDYDNPEKTITLKLRKRAAENEAVGGLLVNPGGPGAQGQDMAKMASQFFDDDILANFDIIGFDPRGVGESTPIQCLNDQELIEALDQSFPDTPEGDEQDKRATEDLVNKCIEKHGDYLKFVGTRQAARDMDVIRHVLGDPRLYYVGYSYGTSLGGMYAQLFPQNVGRMILDGAVDSSISGFEQTLYQAKGFESALDAYLEQCTASGDCVAGKTVEEARQNIKNLFDQVTDHPLPAAGGRELTKEGLFYGIAAPLYDDEAWFALDLALDEALNQGKGDMFVMMYDMYMGRDGDTFTSNQTQANWAINCADAVVEGDEALWKEQEKQIEEASPLFGPVMGYSDYMCSLWPGDHTQQLGPFTAEGSQPIVVVGTTGDPATPYGWGQSFAKNLDNSIFVTWEGEGHTAYGRAGDCLNKPLDAYLLNGALPEDGLTCTGDE